MNEKEAEKELIRLEQLAKDRYIEHSEWRDVIDMLDPDEKKKLNEVSKIFFGEDHPQLQ